MDNYKLVNPEQMLRAEDKIYVTADINQALIDYGLIVKSDFLKWFILGEDLQDEHVDELIARLSYSLLNRELEESIRMAVLFRIDKYLENLPGRKRVALSFILLNSKSFLNSVKENVDIEEVTEIEFKAIFSREVKKQVYVCGSFEMESRIKDYLFHQVCRFAKEFNFSQLPLPGRKVADMIDLFGKNDFATIGL